MIPEIKIKRQIKVHKYPIYIAYDIDLKLVNSELQLRLEQARAVLLLFDTKPNVDDVPDYAIVDKFSRINPPLYIGNYHKEDHAKIAKQFADNLADHSGRFGIEQQHEIVELIYLPLLN